jgi:hypothetical protein
MLRTSERGTQKRCEFEWYISYVRQVRMGPRGPALRFGALVHQALAQYYIKGTRRGKNPVRTFEKLYDQDVIDNESRFGWRLDGDDKWQEARDIGVGMLGLYLETYGSDPDWEVLATEMPFKTLVFKPRSLQLGDSPEPWFWAVGILDGVWRHRPTKEIWIPDHKTAASVSDSKLSYLQMDDQAGSYWSYGVDFLIAHAYLKQNQKLAGMYYNFMRKGVPDERESKMADGKRVYLNLDGSVSKRQPPEMFKRIRIWRDEADRAMARERTENDFKRNQMLRHGELTIGKTPGQFTCPTCPIRDLCELHEVGGDWQEFLETTTHPWEPYSDHEIYAGDAK